MNDVVIILETKSEEKDINKQAFIDELMKNIDIISSKYKKLLVFCTMVRKLLYIKTSNL